MPTIRVRVKGRQRLERLATRLAAAGVGFQDDCADGARNAAPAVLAAVRSAWLTIEVDSTRGGGSSSGLRGRAANATDTQPIPIGVRFEVDGSVIDPAYGRSLAWSLNGMGRWRHPVFGNTRAWTQQTGEEVFVRTIRANEPVFIAAEEQVLEDLRRRIAG